MRAYILRRLLLMIPTLFGVTLVTFLIMRLAPGDPLKMQLSQGGAQGESQQTREAYVLQRRQWKLDKPAFLNVRWFRDYADEARTAARLMALEGEAFAEALSRLAADGPETAFLRGLGIEGFESLRADPKRRPLFARRVHLGLQIFIEEHGEYLMKPLADILSDASADPSLKTGAIRALNHATLGNPFTYTYSTDPDPAETEAVTSTWEIWWKRRQDAFPVPPPDRVKALEASFAALVAEPSRGKILAAVGEKKDFNEISASDAAFFAEKLLGDTALKEKYVAAIVLLSTHGRPLRVDLPPAPSADDVRAVAENWIAYVQSRATRYYPSFPRRLWRFFADTQYANSLAKLVTFDFGRSMVKPYDPVGRKILDAALVSAPLMLLAQMVVYLIAIPAGVVCAVNRGRAVDRSISLSLFLLYSVPSFVAALIFLTFFCYGQFLEIFPMYGLHSEGYQAWSWPHRMADYLWHAVLPVVCLSLFSLAGLAMYARSSMLDVINQDYIRTARAKGLAERSVVYKHALRNGLIPVITLFASFVPALLGGSVLIEYLFGIPGMGRLSLESILAKDYNTLMALIYIDAIVVMLSILLSDLLYVAVDPRITFGSGGA